MARIFITGSSDGLGMLAARELVKNGHEVVLHARNPDRGKEAMKKVKNAQAVFTGDLSDLDETKKLADEVNRSGVFDAVIHNAGVYQVSSKTIFAVNTLAPYSSSFATTSCKIDRPVVGRVGGAYVYDCEESRFSSP
jgi:short-subunit dehydrogenase